MDVNNLIYVKLLNKNELSSVHLFSDKQDLLIGKLYVKSTL
jgi:hypothetical protein